MNALLLNLSGLGDVVSGLVVAEALAAAGHGVTLATRPEFLGLLDDSPYGQTTVGHVGGTPFDLLVDLTGSRESRRHAGRISARRKIGRFRNRLQRLRLRHVFDDGAAKAGSGHIVRDFYPLVDLLALPPVLVPRLDIPPRPQGATVVIHIGAGSALRQLPEVLICGLVARLCAGGVPVRFAGTERERAERLCQACAGYPDWEPTSLRVLRDHLAQAAWVVAPDSGIFHLAAALGTPCVGVFGPNTSSRSGALAPLARHVELPLACRPCTQGRPCRVGGRCLSGITADMVLQAMGEVAPGRESAGPATRTAA